MSGRVSSKSLLRADVVGHSRLGSEHWVTIVLLGSGLLGGGIALASRRLLPNKYFFDSGFIQSVAQRRNLIAPDESYSSAATFYRSLGLENSPVLVAVLSLAVFFVAVSIALPSEIRHAASLPTAVLVGVSFVLAGIYLGQFSKDTIVLVAVVVLIRLSRVRYAVPAMASFALAYATMFRTYWILVAICFVVLELSCRRRLSARRLCLGIVVSLAICALLVEFEYGKDLSVFRRSINAARIGSPDAVSVIKQYISSGGLAAGWLNSLLTLLLLLVPVPLILLASPIYLASAAFLGSLTLRARQFASSGMFDQTARRGVRARSAVQARHCLLMAVALVVVQSIYVPDYGSALKHFTPILPLMIAALARFDWLRASVDRNGGDGITPSQNGAVTIDEARVAMPRLRRLEDDGLLDSPTSRLAFDRALGLPDHAPQVSTPRQ